MANAKRKRLSGLLMGLALAICFAVAGGLTAITKPVANAEEAYDFGSATTQATRVEAENYATNTGKITSVDLDKNGNPVNPYLSNGKLVEMGAAWNDSAVEYTLDVPEAGNYVVKLRYWTGTNGLKFLVVANKGTENESSVESTTSSNNGWGRSSTYTRHFVNAYNLHLIQGQNTIYITQAKTPSGYINLDAFEIYKEGAVYYYENEKRTNPTDEHLDYFTIGDRIEGESFYQKGGYEGASSGVALITRQKDNGTLKTLSNGAMIEVNERSIKTTVNIPKTGKYIVKFGYGTGSTVSGMKLCSTFVQYTLDEQNNLVVSQNVSGEANLLYHTSWTKEGGMHTLLAQTQEMELNAGVQELLVYQGGTNYYINLDFVEIYAADAVKYYPIEKNLYPELTGGWTVGDRMEAEYGIWVTGRTYIENESSPNISNRLYYALDCKNNYNVTVPEAGKYAIEIVDAANNSANSEADVFVKKYTVEVNGKTFTYTDFNEDWYEWSSANGVMTHHRFEVELEKGLNTLAITPTCTTHSKIDYYRILPIAVTPDAVIQAEDMLHGQVMLNKHQDTFPEITGYVAELHASRPGSIVLPVTIPAGEAGIYEFYLRGWTGADGSFMMSINGAEAQKYTTQNSGWLTDNHSIKDNVYLLDLKEGANTLTITRNVVDNKYVDFDWFFLTKHKLATEPNDGDGFTVRVGEELEISTIDLTAEQSGLVEIDGGKVTGLNVGKTNVSYTYLAGDYPVVRTYPLTVEKGKYVDAEIAPPDQKVKYNGTKQAYKPFFGGEGWTVTATNNDGITDPGSYVVTLTYTHPNYVDVVRTATFTVERADYTGTELVADNQTVKYNGKLQSYVAPTAPAGWTVTVAGNDGLTNPGSYDVTVTFTHVGYNTVTKEAKFTVERADYTGTDLVANDQTVKYNGKQQSYVAPTAPAGWTVDVAGNDGLANPGSYDVTVTFTHVGYNTVTDTAKFTVERADYTGTDLLAPDQGKDYNGAVLSYDGATAPSGWEISIAGNDGMKMPGTYEVTVTFTHPGYNTVTKTAQFSVWKITFEGTGLMAPDQRKPYNGELQTYTAAVAPSDEWTISFSGNDGLTTPGSYEVTVHFSHDYYDTVDQTALFFVYKATYTGTDLVFENKTVTYDGTAHSIEATAPIGWTIRYSDETTMTNAGEQEIIATFTHDCYETVEKTATLKVNKAVYAGAELVVSDVTVTYDGEAHKVDATAPAGWTIVYAEDAATEIGTYVMTVTFSNANYEDVTMTATLTIKEAKKGCGGSIVGGIGGLIALLAAGALICGKKKAQ